MNSFVPHSFKKGQQRARVGGWLAGWLVGLDSQRIRTGTGRYATKSILARDLRTEVVEQLNLEFVKLQGLSTRPEAGSGREWL